ncbi:MAG TPA: SMC family ATPase, partial [Dehalococcoidia bacterium]|nr:SMC family ATPase [Dehalococcoidia bacterium]
MRPQKLEVEGFTAFRQRTCIDFSNLDLFAITGQTGAGKSSLIDAICYALYGATPRMRDKVGSCISPGLPALQVVLEFEANGSRFRVLRESRRKGTGNTRLEQWSGEGWQPLSDRAREVTQMIERIVGLDFEAFIRSALLPQGQFQEFLAGSPENRRDVLRRLLRMDVYERMQSRAGQEAQAIGVRISEIERRLREELADATPESLEVKRAELTEAAEKEQGLTCRIGALQAGIEVARQLTEARAETAKHEVALAETAKLLARSTSLAEGGGERLAALQVELTSVTEELAKNC